MRKAGKEGEEWREREGTGHYYIPRQFRTPTECMNPPLAVLENVQTSYHRNHMVNNGHTSSPLHETRGHTRIQLTGIDNICHILV